MISYKLKKYEISLLHSICWELDSMVDNLISREIKQIVEKVLMSSEISKDEVERLLKLLPQLELIPVESQSSEEASIEDIVNEDWPEWQDFERAKQSRKLRLLEQQLSNWLFTQYVVHQKQLHSHSSFVSLEHMTVVGKKNEKSF